MSDEICEHKIKGKQLFKEKTKHHLVTSVKNTKKILALTLSIFIVYSSFSQISEATTTGVIEKGNISIEYSNITVYAPAVAKTENGYKGVISTITVTIQTNGSGRVFVDTLPLTQIDMQGSARLAVKVAGSLIKNDRSCNIDPNNYDFFFVIRTSSPIIGGPSAGAVMTLATIALLENWTIDNKTIMTGMINPDGSIGPVGGIPQKIDAAYSAGATQFLIPKGQMEYTEMVTETNKSNIWWQTITHLVTLNLSDYAMKHYGIKVFEIADINDALRYTTGHYFPLPNSDYQITAEEYINTMKPLATNLLNNAEKSYNNAKESFDNSEIPNRFPYYYKNQITDHLNYAEDYLKDARRLYKNNSYYSSASKSFQSLINSHFVMFSCDYFSSDNNQEYIQNLLNRTRSLNDKETEKAKNTEINGMISLQCVGAAQKRAAEASKYLKDAEQNYNNYNPLNTLYKIAFAEERSRSIGWWINLSTQFQDVGKINNSTLLTLTEDYIENAQQSIAYSTILLQEMKKNSDYLTSANEMLNIAINDKKNGYPAAALFEALEALVKGNLALELVDGVTKDKIKRAQENAAISISNSRKLGIEPILSVSYYELAKSLTNESSYENAMFEYKYSDLIAGLIKLTNGDYSKKYTSRYIGIPKQPIHDLKTVNLNNSNNPSIISLGSGIAIGIIIGVFIRNKKKSPGKLEKEQ